MVNMDCIYEKGYHFFIGLVFALIGFAFLGLGITVLPVVGFFIALPILGLSVFFFRNPRSEECFIKET
ncbi:MAG: hypothetical protein ACOCW9_03305 [Thermodesulfobacteriota bacterium]